MSTALNPITPEQAKLRIERADESIRLEGRLESAIVALIDMHGHAVGAVKFADAVQRAFARRAPVEGGSR